NKLILGIFVEQQILRSVCLGACRPVLGLLPDRRIGQQLLQQRRHFLPALRRIFFLGVKLASRLDKLLQRAHITSSNVRNEQLFQVIIIPTDGLRSNCPASGKTNRLSNPTPCWLTARINQDSAVESEAQDKAQAFRSECNGPLPLSAVAGSRAMSGVLNRCERSPK